MAPFSSALCPLPSIVLIRLDIGLLNCLANQRRYGQPGERCSSLQGLALRFCQPRRDWINGLKYHFFPPTFIVFSRSMVAQPSASCRDFSR
jgi:hypothetical protein